MRLLAASLAAVLSAGLLTLATPAGAACVSDSAFPDPEDPPVSIGAPTLVIDVRAVRAGYKRGEKAQLKVDVRSGTAGGPKAADAHVDVVIKQSGRTLVKLLGETDSGGGAVIRFTVPRHWATGTVSAVASAKQALVPSYDCRAPLVYQGGQRTLDPLFTVRR